jgi:predicted house-cleaning noncanonical NTP pyrophosphatase (MazG superfamily)
MEKIYNKLVRDRIPEIIEKDNARPKIRTLENKEYLKALYDKLEEEAAELKNAIGKEEAMKEIGDVYEVLEAIIKSYKLDEEEIRKLQNQRRETRGGFEKGIFLESVEE